MWRVSSVLTLVGLSQPHKALDPMYRERGTAIHAAAEALAMGYDPAVVPEYQGYIDALRLWFRTESPTIIAIERRIVNRLKKLTGRIDFVVIIDGKVWIVDVKTGSPMIHYRWQTALYAILVCDDGELLHKVMEVLCGGEMAGQSTLLPKAQDIGRAILYLNNETGRPKFVPQTDPNDIYIARAALALCQIRHENGLLEFVDKENPDDDEPVVQVAQDQPF